MELNSDLHINLLELRAAKEAVLNFAQEGDVIQLHLDNKVACAYIRKQGGTKSNDLSQEACELWDQIQSQKIQLLAPHWITTQENVKADYLSCHKIETWELELNQEIFNQIVSHYGVAPTLDALASRKCAK